MIRVQGERSLQGWEERGDSVLSVVLWRISPYVSGLQKKKKRKDVDMMKKSVKNDNKEFKLSFRM